MSSKKRVVIKPIDMISHKIEVITIDNCKKKRKIKKCDTCCRFYECYNMLVATALITKTDLYKLNLYTGNQVRKQKHLQALISEILKYKDSV